MSQETCFLCKILCKEIRSVAAIVPGSSKTVAQVLQHLANNLKTKLIFQYECCVCMKCFEKLAAYDELMLKLLVSQRALVKELQSALSYLSDAKHFVETDQSEEFITKREPSEQDSIHEFINVHATEDKRVETHLLDDVTVENDDIAVENDDVQMLGTDDESEDIDDNWSEAAYPKTGGECGECGEVFTSKYQLSCHRTEVHKPKMHICKVCGVSRKDEEYLELHMNLHEGKTEKECRYCDKKFSRPVNTLRHMRKHWNKKKYQCEKCGERFSMDNVLYNHRLIHEAQENPLICRICNQVFKSRKTYNHHMVIHQENRPRHYCSLCPKSFTERYTLKIHMKTHGLTDIPSEGVNTPGAVVSLFSRSEEAEAIGNLGLEEIVSDDMTHICVICSMKFDEKHDLDQHLQADHDVILK